MSGIPANHQPKYYTPAGDDEGYKVVCLRCGQGSAWVESRQEAEDWWYKHEAEIEKLKARLGTRTPTLHSQARYYREMAESSTGHEQELWERLAGELERRLTQRWVDVPLAGMP